MTSGDPRRGGPLALLLAAALAAGAACGSGHSSGTNGINGTNGTNGVGGTPPNVMALSVNGTGCSAGSYLNKPCVSVQVCVPGTSTCQRVDDLLLDTGSTGLRIFASVLSGLALPKVAVPGGTLAECIGFLDGSAQWGPVATADVVLGSEPPVAVPVQLIDSTFVPGRTQCSGADPDPATAGFNGILGVTNWKEDCGSGCVGDAANGMYFACGAASCSGVVRALAGQVRNPVAALPLDNNGLVIKLPAAAAAGVPAVEGTLLLGVGTRSNNALPAGALTFQLDRQGEFRTSLPGGAGASRAFTDTGSNGVFFEAPSGAGLTACQSYADWFCPASTLSLSAVNTASSGLPSAALSFQIGSFQSIMIDQPTVYVSPAVGGPLATYFDWGLPFFLGRDVYLGLETPTGNGWVAY